MNKRIRSIVIATVLTAFVLILGMTTLNAGSSTTPSTGMADDTVIVKMKSLESESVDLASIFARYGITSHELLNKAGMAKKITTEGIYLLKLQYPGTQQVLALCEQLKEDSRVKFVSPNFKVQLNLVPNDPNYTKQYALPKISAPKAWEITTGSASVTVAVLDTGIDYNHPDLSPNMWINKGEIAGNKKDDDSNGYIDDVYGYDFMDNDSDPMDVHNHGSHCAGIISAAGNNKLGISGVCWNVKVAALKIFNTSGTGEAAPAIKALDYANAMGFEIASNSWGDTPTAYQGFVELLREAVSDYRGLFVCAAGNDGKNNETYENYPCNYRLPNMLVVAASDSNDKMAGFSNYSTKMVDLAAPGVNIYSTIRNKKYSNMSGTSMACPYVSGAAALVKSEYGNLTTQQLRQVLMEGVDKISGMSTKVVTGGRLNVNASLEKAMALTAN